MTEKYHGEDIPIENRPSGFSLPIPERFKLKYVTSNLNMEFDGLAQMRTVSLFYENKKEDKTYSIYTTRDEDFTDPRTSITYPSLRRRYLSMRDTTEVRFAEKYLYNYPHLLKMTTAGWFKKLIESWREELSLLLESEALSVLIEKAASGDVNAAKFIVSMNKKTPTNRGNSKGRPSKSSIEEKAKDLINFNSSIVENIDDDLERILNSPTHGLIQ